MIWFSRSLQFVWFPNDVAHLDARRIFTDAVGKDPDLYQVNRIPSAKTPFLGMAAGVLNDVHFQAVITPGRTEIIVSGDPDASNIDDEKRFIDTRQVVQDMRSRLGHEFFEKLGDINRMSIVATLLKPQDNYESAAQLLVKLCDIDLKLDGHSDIQFQINRRKTLVGNVQINRLMRFAVELQRVIAFEVNPDSGETVSQSPVGDERIFSALTLDFNTAPEGKTLNPEQVPDIFRSIADELLRIADDQTVASLSDN